MTFHGASWFYFAELAAITALKSLQSKLPSFQHCVLAGDKYQMVSFSGTKSQILLCCLQLALLGQCLSFSYCTCIGKCQVSETNKKLFRPDEFISNKYHHHQTFALRILPLIKISLEIVSDTTESYLLFWVSSSFAEEYQIFK